MFDRKAKQREELDHFVASLADSNGTMAPQALQRYMTHSSQNKLSPELRDLGLNEIFIGLANGGMFIRRSSSLLLHPDEEAVWVTAAELLHEAKKREYRGTSGGISIPLGHGIRYRASEIRGRVVTLGTHWEAADSGQLTVTNRRILYSGKRKTLEFPLEKLVTLNVFSDGVDLGVSGRSTNATLRVRNPHLTAATIKGLLDHRTGIKLIEIEGVT